MADTEPPDPTATAAHHAPVVVVEMLPCYDGFWRNFFRGGCSCGWRGHLRNYRLQAWNEADDHAD